MTRILVDAHLAAQLKASQQPLELCDPSGDTVGHFTPLQKLKVPIPFSEDEIQSSKAKTGGRALADILADLENR